MADERNQVYLPVGRFVSGSMTKKKTQTGRGQPIPENKQQFEFGIAISKTAPETQVFFQQLQQAAHQAFVGTTYQATVGQYIDNWFQTMAGFSMKIADGDKPAASTGKVNENTVGHFVVWFSSNYPPTCFTMGGQPIDAASIERGYFVDGMCGINANSNAPGDGIGIYMNPDMIRFAKTGPVITGGPDFNAMLAKMPIPTGIDPNATPVSSPPAGVAPMQPAGAPQMGAPAQQPTTVPQPGAPAQPPMQPPASQPMVPQSQPMGAPAQPPMGVPATPPATPAGGAPQMPNGAPGATTSPPSLPMGQPQQQQPQYPAHPGIMPGGGGLPGTG